MTTRKVVFLVIICVLLLSCVVTESKAQEGYEFICADSTGWSVFAMKPADETKRVDDFERMFDSEECREGVYEKGYYQLYKEMRRVFYENWWSALIYIPPEHFIQINANSKFIMIGIDKKGHAAQIESEAICFAKGWLQGQAKRQYMFFDNRKSAYQVRYSANPSINDFESNPRGGYYYLVAYVYFGEHQSLQEVTGFVPTGIKAYPIKPTISRR